MRQANQLGGSVRKDEHSQVVVFWKVDQEADARSKPDPETLDANNKTRAVLSLSPSPVYSASAKSP
jgi:antirestriction protein ArdC